MTLIAGLVTSGGIIFASDSEESGGYRKASAEKIVSAENPGGASIVVSGAGHGALIDYTAQRILTEATPFPDLSKVLHQIEIVLREVFTDHVRLQPVRNIEHANFELLLGIKAKTDSQARLYLTSGISIIEKTKYQAAGSGALVDYILGQMYHESMTQEDAICACLNLLGTAKEYVDGVGGDAHIKVLSNAGDISEKPDWEVKAEEGLARKFTEHSSKMLFSTLRTYSGTDSDFERALKEFGIAMHNLRKEKKASDEIIKKLIASWKANQEKKKREEEEATKKESASQGEKPSPPVN